MVEMENVKIYLAHLNVNVIFCIPVTEHIVMIVSQFKIEHRNYFFNIEVVNLRKKVDVIFSIKVNKDGRNSSDTHIDNHFYYSIDI